MYRCPNGLLISMLCTMRLWAVRRDPMVHSPFDYVRLMFNWILIYFFCRKISRISCKIFSEEFISLAMDSISLSIIFLSFRNYLNGIWIFMIWIFIDFRLRKIRIKFALNSQLQEISLLIIDCSLLRLHYILQLDIELFQRFGYIN